MNSGVFQNSALKRTAFTAVLFAVALATSACANRWREGDAGKTPEEVRAHLDAIVSKGFSRDQATLQKAMTMVDDDSTNVYFAEANGAGEGMSPMGPLHAVAPIDFNVLEAGLKSAEIKNIRIYYIDRLTDAGHEGALVFEITKKGGEAAPVVKVFYRDADSGFTLGDVQEDETFSFTLDGSLNAQEAKPNIRIVTEDFDVKNDDLKPTIQLELYYEDTTGTEYSMGQVSTLVGYGR